MRIILIASLLIALCGGALYLVKTSVDSRYDELARLKREIQLEKKNTLVLEAEWAYLSRPDRIQTLSSGLLAMQPITKDRILPLQAIPMRPGTSMRSADAPDNAIDNNVVTTRQDIAPAAPSVTAPSVTAPEARPVSLTAGAQ